MGDWDVTGTAPLGDWDVVSHSALPHENAEPADHGLSERQKLSPIGKALNPITSYPETYQRMNREAQDQVSRGVGQLGNGPWETTKGLGNIALGSAGFVASPINAAYRSIIGQPVEDVTGIPREYTEFGAQLATPGLGMTRLPKAPGVAAEAAPLIKPTEGPDLSSIEAETNRALGREFGIDYTRGQATRDLEAIRHEDMAARGTYGKELQDLAAPKFEEQFGQIQRAGQGVGERLNRGQNPLNDPADAGASLNAEVANAAEAARRQSAGILSRAGEEEAVLRRGVTDQGNALTEGIAGDNPLIESPRDAGEMVSDAVRAAAQRDREAYGASYREAYQTPGEFRRDTFTGLGDRIRNEMTLSDNPMVVDQLTPAANGALTHLDNVSNLRLVNRADPRVPPNPDDIAAINLQGLDRARKILQDYYRRAATPTDRAATSRIISEFDGQVERAISEGLFSGDPRALTALQRARGQFRQYQQTYNPQGAGDDVGTAMRRIVQRNATPEETANMIVGSGKIGSTGLPVRIADRLETVLGADSPQWNAIRQAQWQKASQVRRASGEIDPARSASSIMDFTRSSLGQRMFAPDELTAMRAHAQGMRDLDGIIERLPSRAAAARAEEGYQQIFGAEGLGGRQKQVLRRMADGTATPEETSQAIFSVIGGGNPGDASRALGAIERIVGADSPVMGSVRQGVWQKLTQNPFGKDQVGQQKMVQSINEFLNGKGKDVAKQLYSPEERALMSRYAEAVRRTIIPKYSRTGSDTAVATGAKASRTVASITSMIASALHFGPIGHFGGHAVSKMISNKIGRAYASQNAKSLADSLADVVPEAPKAKPQRSSLFPRVPPSPKGQDEAPSPLRLPLLSSPKGQDSRNAGAP
jgi:hypothetical protein